MHKQIEVSLVRALVFAGVFVSVWSASAREIRVGSGQECSRPSEAFGKAQPGDVIIIGEGLWKDDVAAFSTPNLTIRGAGIDKTIIDAAVFTPSSMSDDSCRHLPKWKGIWVVGGVGCVIEGVTFRNARVPSDAGSNGAGIRYEADGDVTIRNCSFTGCQNGILCGKLPDATMTVEGCAFHGNGNRAEWGGKEGYTHNLYIGEIKELIFRNCVSDHAWAGHNLKSRAYRTTILNSVFDDANDGHSSYLVDCPNGGVVTIRNCTFVQSETAVNGVMIAIGEEGAYERTSLVESGNKFTDYRNGQIWNLNFPGSDDPKKEPSLMKVF